jgi:hypothetical protein
MIEKFAMLCRLSKLVPEDGQAIVPLARVRAIATALAPSTYTSVGKSEKRQPRHPVYKQAIAVLGDGEQIPVVIRNLSHTGCRIEFVKDVKPAGRLRLIEQSLALEAWANVVWMGHGACGLAFEDCEALLDPIASLEATFAPTRDPPRAPSRQERKARISIRKR